MQSVGAPDPTGEHVRRIDIVIVDDDGDALEVTALALVDLGFSVRAFACAELAADDIVRQPPDVVVSDLVLSGALSGADLAMRIRGADGTRELPVIAVTGMTDPEWATVRLFDAYLRKPFDVALLSGLARTLVAGGRASARRISSVGS